jgi:three-Cys-motif partner protein
MAGIRAPDQALYTAPTVPPQPPGDDPGVQLDFGLTVEPMGRRGRLARPSRAVAARRLDDHPQTRVKLDALRNYLPRFILILGQGLKARHVYIIDLFAGPGRYADGADPRGWSEGSPLVACEAALYAQEWLRDRGFGTEVHLRFVEKSKRTANLLRAALAPFTGKIDYAVVDGTAEDAAPVLLTESRGHPTLAFLDPDGFKELPFEVVRSFGRRYTEVLISFDVQGVIRVAGLEDAGLVTAFYGDDMWRAMRRDDGSIDADVFLEGYRQRLAVIPAFRYTSVRRIHFPKNHANRAIAQGCGSRKGLQAWSEAIRKAKTTDGVLVLDIAREVERRDAIDRAIELLAPVAGSNVRYGAILQVLAQVDLPDPDVHQVLLFMRELGQVTWTSTLHAASVPPPIFGFAEAIEPVRWDGVTRAEERPALRALPAGGSGGYGPA